MRGLPGFLQGPKFRCLGGPARGLGQCYGEECDRSSPQTAQCSSCLVPTPECRPRTGHPAAFLEKPGVCIATCNSSDA